jgi:hypothetical protein
MQRGSSVPSVWDHDLWQEIYAIHDPEIKAVLASLYRLILDMRESDVLADKISARVNQDRKIALSVGAKVWGALLGAAILVDIILNHIH